ncbi:hypothetical protein [Clostridium perfringens]|nr:hypothetical protein [Clostridium perfringens]
MKSLAQLQLINSSEAFGLGADFLTIPAHSVITGTHPLENPFFSYD